MRQLYISFILLVVLVLTACGSDDSKNNTADNTAPITDTAEDSTATFAEFLQWVPNTPENREWLVYGDYAAWYTSWDVPQPADFEAADAMERELYALWFYVQHRQVFPARPLEDSLQSITLGEERPFYGFDIFSVNRFIGMGNPPTATTLIDHTADPVTIDAALTASGYTPEDLGDGWTLYRIYEDGEFPPLDAKLPYVGQLGLRNRIALNGSQMLITRDTTQVTQTLASAAGDYPSLADDPAYTAVAAALDDPALADTGNLLSVIVMPGAEIAGDPLVALLNSGTGTPETQEEAREQLGLNEPRKLLPPYELAAFATSHDPDASWLTVILTFPADMEILAPYDWAYFRDLLAEKISTYPGMAQSGLPLIDRWTFAHAHALEIDGVAVITATMRVDNPPPPVDGEDYRPYIMRWAELIQQNDLAFLAQMDADTLAGE